MHHRQQRARRRPGPLRFVVMAIVLGATAVRAHDPGLSGLDVSVSGGAITASLSISSADAAQVVAPADANARQRLGDLARDSVRIAIAGRVLAPASAEVDLVEGGVRVQLSYVARRSASDKQALTVTSDLPRRMPRGHRELLVVSVDGRVVSERLLDADADSLAVDLAAAPSSRSRNAWSFLTLGVHHILSGYDHLVFLAGLILAACTVRELLVALTAFTAAHSVSLSLVAVAGVHAPPSIVEPLIAASIAWVGIENLWRGQRRSRWWIVFGFGLVHGFGFAGALMDLGVGASARDIAVALLSFNGGVEAGQLAAAAAMLPVVRLMRSRPLSQARLVPLCSVLIVAAGGYWLIERLW